MAPFRARRGFDTFARHERGRTDESVIRQYTGNVRPMHLEFVESSNRCADIIIPEGRRNRDAVDMLITSVRSVLDSSD